MCGSNRWALNNSPNRRQGHIAVGLTIPTAFVPNCVGAPWSSTFAYAPAKYTSFYRIEIEESDAAIIQVMRKVMLGIKRRAEKLLCAIEEKKPIYGAPPSGGEQYSPVVGCARGILVVT